MTYLPLENFAFTDNEVDLGAHVQLQWVNDGSVDDVGIQSTERDTQVIPTQLQERIDSSWHNLEQRAAHKLETVSGVNHFFSDELLAFGSYDLAENVVSVSTGVDYKTVTATRSGAKLYADMLAAGQLASAYVVKSILVTVDNQIVLGRRTFFGDWPSDCYECPGGFLGQSDIVRNSIGASAVAKITDDYTNAVIASVRPIALYHFDRILETIMLCVARTETHSHDLQSDFYEELLFVENSKAGVEELLGMDHSMFHPPSRLAVKVYQQHGLCN